jgi:hypothetical protein
MLIKVPDILNIKEKEGGQGLSSACTAIESEAEKYISNTIDMGACLSWQLTLSKHAETNDQHIIMEADATAVKDIQMEQHTEPGSMAMVNFNIAPSKNAAVEMKKQPGNHIKLGGAVTVDFFPPSENAPITDINTQCAGPEPSMSNALPLSTEAAATDTEELTGERTSAILDHLNEFLVSSIVDATSDTRMENHEPCNAMIANEHSDHVELQNPNSSNDPETPAPVQPIEMGQSGNTSMRDTVPPIDNFIESISRPLPQPLLDIHASAPMLHQIPLEMAPPSCSKRQSIRLAKKAEQNAGKDTIQIAQELLAKKLGELLGVEKDHTNDEFEFYAQHFARPMEKDTMEAIQGLIEQAHANQKKGQNKRNVVSVPERLA